MNPEIVSEKELRKSSSSLAPFYAKLKCPTCTNSQLLSSNEKLHCNTCKGTFPLESGKFPNFLSKEDQKKIQNEITFWETHFSGVDYSPESESSYQHLIQLIGANGHKEVLEIGCGSAALLRRLPATLKVGLEPVSGLLKSAAGEFHGVIGIGAKLPFSDNSFDLVYFKDSLHHVEEKYRAVCEAVWVLKPEGRLVVIEPNALHPQRRAISNPNSVFRTLKVLRKIIGPVESFQTPNELLRWAKDLNLSLEKLEFFNPKYDKTNVRQFLQGCYYQTLKSLVPNKYLLPEYFISFRKSYHS